MITHPTLSNPASYLRGEYERQGALFQAQPAIVQRFLEAQAQRLAEALLKPAHQVRFSLPDRIVSTTPSSGELVTILIPAELREQTAGGWRMQFEQQVFQEILRRKLSELEQSPDRAIHTSVGLMRYALVSHLVHNLLPAGRSVNYRADEDELIPTFPVKADGEKASAITSAADAIVEQNPNEGGRGDLQVPFVPAARRFYLPQWVAFDEHGQLLVNSVTEAEAQLVSMQRYINILHLASSFAPYMVADDEYQRKRYGMLGQVINQGRALARYKTEQIIQTIVKRVDEGTLNRGLSISLPYYNDQELQMKSVELEIIPAGRIAFKPVFVLRATRMEQAKVTQDTRLNASTRKYLLQQLELLEQAFIKFQEQVVP